MSKKTKIKIIKGDITAQAVNAIVNAANESLKGGGGVDAAIHKEAGPELLKECKTLDGCHTGGAKITKGYKLNAHYVIHTVGPIWNDGKSGESKMLKECYENSLALAKAYGLHTIAFPAISAGAYGYPMKKAAHIALRTTFNYIKKHKPDFTEIIFVLFSDHAYNAYQKEYKKLTRKKRP